ncbi:hypothetical protein, conserved [Eimeria tenella]|nr:hypothetical protein, conserved [Eimeria tenella]CDJ40444.1 hypothetical protein, conserved [Eimeria tenella]|eukprot:XP_013231194.1 hypothetical protein, conserved [Eimeria tenella]
MGTGRRAPASPRCGAHAQGHETLVARDSSSKVMGSARRQTRLRPFRRCGLLALVVLQLLLVGHYSAAVDAARSADIPVVENMEGEVSAHTAGGVAQRGASAGVDAGVASQNAGPVGVTVSSEEQEKANLELLRTFMLEADATETEKSSDTQYFLGVMSQKIKRHFLVDLLSVVLLFAGYYILATGLEPRPTPKPTAKAPRV